MFGYEDPHKESFVRVRVKFFRLENEKGWVNIDEIC